MSLFLVLSLGVQLEEAPCERCSCVEVLELHRRAHRRAQRDQKMQGLKKVCNKQISAKSGNVGAARDSEQTQQSDVKRCTVCKRGMSRFGRNTHLGLKRIAYRTRPLHTETHPQVHRTTPSWGSRTTDENRQKHRPIHMYIRKTRSSENRGKQRAILGQRGRDEERQEENIN